MKKTTIDMEDELWVNFKTKCIREHTTMGEVIRTLIRGWIEEKKR